MKLITTQHCYMTISGITITHISQEVWKILADIHLHSEVKYDCHGDNFYETPHPFVQSPVQNFMNIQHMSLSLILIHKQS
jgi:hypothetical protein